MLLVETHTRGGGQQCVRRFFVNDAKRKESKLAKLLLYIFIQVFGIYFGTRNKLVSWFVSFCVSKCLC